MSGRRRYRVLVCRGSECGDKRNSRDVYNSLQQLVEGCGVGDRVNLDWQSCFGRCSQGPNVLVREVDVHATRPTLFAAPRPVRGAKTALYNGVDATKVRAIVEGHLAGDEVQIHLIKARAPAGAAPTEPSPTAGESEKEGK